MSLPKTLRWVIAAPCAFAVGVAVALGAWHVRGKDFAQYFQRETTSSQAGSNGGAGEPNGPGSPGTALPPLVQGAMVSNEPQQPARKEFAAMLEREKQGAANELLTAYILSNEQLPKLSEPATERPPDHPLVEELINKPNAMRNASGSAWIPNTYGIGGPGGYPQGVLKEAVQAFNSPGYAPLRADAKAVADMTLGQVSTLMDLSEDVQGRLERGSGGGSLGGLHRFGNGLNLSSSTRRAVGHIVTNALGGSGYSYGSGGGSPFTGNYMTPPVGSSTAPATVTDVDSSELAAVATLETEYRRLLPSMSDAEMKEYLRRVETDGKIAAMQWVVWMKGGR